MVTVAHLVSLGTLCGALVAAGVGVAALRRRPDPLAVPMAALLFAVAVWTACDALAVLPTGLPAGFWVRLSFLAVAVVPSAWYVLTVRYAGYGHWVTRWTVLLLVVEPAVALLAAFAHPDLVWHAIDVGRIGGVPVIVTRVGPAWWLNLVYSYAIVLVGVGFLFDVLVRSTPIYRKQATLLLVAATVPLTTNGLGVLFAGTGPAMGFTAASFVVTSVTFALALFFFDLLDLRPVAREVLVEDLADGMLVVDDDGRITDYNTTAAATIDALAAADGGLASGRATEVASGRPSTADETPSDATPDDATVDVGVTLDALLPAEVGADGRLTATVDGRRRHYHLESRSLADRHGRQTGTVVYLRDVTALVEHEQRISVLNRVLRHNVRNELGLVWGYVDEMEAHLPPDDDHLAERARDAVRDLLDLSEKARDVERTVSETSGERAPVAVDEVADRVAERLRRHHPSAVVETDLESARALVVDDSLLENAIWNLGENGVVHAERDDPTVEVEVAAEATRVVVTVRDDGPGVPEGERRALDADVETPLVHASGLGLWIVRWTVELSGGTLGLEDREPRGTVVRLGFDRAE